MLVADLHEEERFIAQLAALQQFVVTVRLVDWELPCPSLLAAITSTFFRELSSERYSRGNKYLPKRIVDHHVQLAWRRK